jgi:hypothetical protein
MQAPAAPGSGQARGTFACNLPQVVKFWRYFLGLRLILQRNFSALVIKVRI